MKSLQERVCLYLKVNKTYKKDFAALIGVSPVHFSHWLNGRTVFKDAILDKIVAIIEPKS